MKKIAKFFIGCLATTLLASCATKLQTTVLRPAELNMNGAKTISVLPFQHDRESYDKIFAKNNNSGGSGNGGNIANGDGNMQQNVQQTVIINLGPQQTEEKKETPEEKLRKEMADYFTSSLNKSLGGSQYLDLVNARTVQDAIQNGKENPADVYLAGYIANYKEGVSDRRTERTDKETGEVTVNVYYKRTVEMVIAYEIIDSTTEQVLASERETLQKSSSEYENPNELPEAMNVIKSSLDNLAAKILKKVQPYPVTMSLSLEKPKDKNQAKDPDFEAAYNAAKNGVLDVAFEGFMSVYKSKGINEAGYNAALILEIRGRYQEAEDLMNEVYKKSQNPKAAQELSHIRNEIRLQQQLEAQLEQQRD